MPALLKMIGPLIMGKMGSNQAATMIVKIFRVLYAGTATVIVVTWYSAWRNERVAPGTGKFPFPGIKNLKARYNPDRPGKDTDPGYQPPAGGGSASGTLAQGNPPGLSVMKPGDTSAGPPSWGGTKEVCDAICANLAGITVVSTKRSTQTTSSGGTSDHWDGCRQCYARDNAGSVKDMDRAILVITKRLGIHYTGGEIVKTVEKGGYRIQVLYRTMVGGDHFNHIHVGVRKVGYEP